jgi:hypothetical protein
MYVGDDSYFVFRPHRGAFRRQPPAWKEARARNESVPGAHLIARMRCQLCAGGQHFMWL